MGSHVESWGAENHPSVYSGLRSSHSKDLPLACCTVQAPLVQSDGALGGRRLWQLRQEQQDRQ